MDPSTLHKRAQLFRDPGGQRWCRVALAGVLALGISSCGVPRSEALRTEGEDDGRWGWTFWDVAPGGSRVLGDLIRLCHPPGEGPVTVTSMRYQDHERLEVTDWSVADRDVVLEQPGVDDSMPTTMGEYPGFGSGSGLVASECGDERQTTVAWEATWGGGEPGFGDQFVIEYADAEGREGALVLDSYLVLCAEQPDCEDLDSQVW